MKRHRKSRPSVTAIRATSSTRGSGLRDRLGWLVFLAVLLVFAAAVANDFVNWDDDQNILLNTQFRGFGADQLEWIFSSYLLGHYQPLTWLSLALDYQFWELDPAGYHATNVALHAVTAVLVYLLFVELLGSALGREGGAGSLRAAAAVGALLFALHPLRVESVAWVSERRDVLSALFYVGTLLLYVRGRRRLALLPFAAALLSKVLAATLAPVLVIVDLYPLRRRIDARLLAEKAPYFALALAAGWIAVRGQGGGAAGVVADAGTYAGLRAALSAYGAMFYLWKTVLPLDLFPQYVYTLDPQLSDPRLVASLLGVLAITALALWQVRRRPWIAAAWGAYLLALAPLLSLLRFDRQQIVADHNSYLAVLGLCCVAAGGWLQFERRSATGARVLAAVVLAALGALTIRQIGTWRESETLWSRTVQGQPLSIVAHNNLARVRAEQGRTDEAVQGFERAVELEPRYAQAHYNLGSVLMRNGRVADAEQPLRSAVAAQPNLAQAHNALGNCLLRLERPQEALEHYQRAVEAAPLFADAHYNFALALELLGRLPEAVAHYRDAVRLDPANTDAAQAFERLQ